MPILTSDEIARFEADGALLVRGAIPADQVAAMRARIWSRLHTKGILEDDPATWTSMNSKPMRPIQRHAVFAAIDSPRLHGAIDDLVGAGRWDVPENWGMFRLSAPTAGAAWQPRADGWHSDCLPAPGQRQALFIFIHFGTTVPGGGGTLLLAGSHRRLTLLAERNAAQRPTLRMQRADFHERSPWLKELMGLAPAERPRSAFMTEPSPPDEFGVRMRVIEATGEPGDVWLCHAIIYHAASDNRSAHMRLMRLKTLDCRAGHTRDDPASDTPLARSTRALPSGGAPTAAALEAPTLSG